VEYFLLPLLDTVSAPFFRVADTKDEFQKDLCFISINEVTFLSNMIFRFKKINIKLKNRVGLDPNHQAESLSTFD
jgi:hypothetical protein